MYSLSFGESLNFWRIELAALLIPMLPHPLIDPLPGEEHAGVAGQQVRDTELRRSKFYRLSPHGGKQALQIMGEFMEYNHTGRFEDAAPRPAEQSADGCGVLCGSALHKVPIKFSFLKFGACICAGSCVKQQEGVFRQSQVEQEEQDQSGPLCCPVQRHHVEGLEHQRNTDHGYGL